MRAFALALLAASAVGASAAPQQPPPVFRAATDLVEVDVVVHDQDGAFVRDLSRDEFTIEEGGVPQEIQQFYVRLSDAGPAGAPATVPADAARPAGRVFLVVFDDQHLSSGGFKRTQAAAERIFEKHFRPGDIGGVLANGRMANDRLTSDRDELIAAVRKAKPSLSAASRQFDAMTWPRLTPIEAVRIVLNNDSAVFAEALQRACADDEILCRRIGPEAVREKAQKLSAETRAESARTLQTLIAALNGLARFEGRKTILLMSEGFIADDAWPLVHDAVGLAARANARIYTLDGRGLDRGVRQAIGVSPIEEDGAQRILEQMDFGADAINSVAVDTGGFVVRNTNMFDKAIQRIADDASNYYVLGYRPTAAQDGKFHSIKVAVTRKGVAVRARRGYLATPRAPALTAAPAPVAAASTAEPREGAAPAAITDAAPEPNPVDEAARSEPSAPSAAAILPRARPNADANTKRLTPASGADPDAAKGWSAYQRGDVETARETLALAAAKPDAHAWVHYTLGLASYALGRYQESVDAWERVRAAAADFEPVYLDLIDAYLQLKEQDRAIRTARAAIDRWPQDPELFQAMGVLQTLRGSLDDAIRSFQAAIALAPDEPNVYFNLAKAMEMRYVRSRRYVQQLRAWVSNDKDRSAAIENYRRHIEMNGAYVESARAGLQRLEWLPQPK